METRAKRSGVSVVVCKQDGENMHSNWIDRVVVQRPQRGLFSIILQKCMKPSDDSLAWETTASFDDLQSPLDIIKILEQSAELLGVDLKWSEVVLGIASLDWVTAAVIADQKAETIPAPPSVDKLRRQRSLQELGKVEISVEWGYDSHDLKLHFATWVRILQGESYSARNGYFYEGKQFTAGWSFDIFREDQLNVGYNDGYDDGGTGWEGSLAGIGYLKGPMVDGVDIAKLALQSAPIALDFHAALTDWLMDGLCLYYRDSPLTEDEINKYEVGEFIRSPIFVDVSPIERPQITNCRYVIASSKAAPLFQINPEVARWQLHTLGCNSLFKILDVQRQGTLTQILLLHIPARGLRYFLSNAVSSLGPRADMKALKQKVSDSIERQKALAPNPDFEDPVWLDRTSIPIGLEPDGNLSPWDPTTSLTAEAANLLSAIRKMTNDIGGLNKN